MYSMKRRLIDLLLLAGQRNSMICQGRPTGGEAPQSDLPGGGTMDHCGSWILAVHEVLRHRNDHQTVK